MISMSKMSNISVMMTYIQWDKGQGVTNKTMSQAGTDRSTAPNDSRYRNKGKNIRCEDADAIRQAYIYMIMMYQEEIYCKCK